MITRVSHHTVYGGFMIRLYNQFLNHYIFLTMFSELASNITFQLTSQQSIFFLFILDLKRLQGTYSGVLRQLTEHRLPNNMV